MSLHDELDYSDVCRIKVRAVHYPSEPPTEIFEIELDSGDSSTGKEVLELIDRELRGPVNFVIDHKRGHSSWGASGGFHEIIVSVGFGVAANLITHLLEFVHARLAQEHGQLKLPWSGEKEITRAAEEALRDAFDARLVLSLQRYSEEDGIAECSFLDSFGERYFVRIDLTSGAKHLRREPREE